MTAQSVAAAGLRIDAPAKINLFLHVHARRADGYHVLHSLIAFVDAGDMLTARPADTLTLSCKGPFAAALGTGDDNLVMRAARALAAETPGAPGAAIGLIKNLPVASGIGGGSADAAAALGLLRRLWRAPVDDGRLAAIGLGLGADVPVCLQARTSWVGGIGETVRPGPDLPSCGVLLVNPGVAVSTAEVYRRCCPAGGGETDAELPASDVRALAAALAVRRNDLAAPATEIAPVIAEVLAALGATPGCLLARLSGSGATCFALYAEPSEAEAAASAIAAAHPGWWVCPTRFRAAAPQPEPCG